MRRENREKIRPNRTQGPAQPPPEPTPSNPTPKPHGDAANGTTNVRWDLSRPSAGRSPPPHVPGQPNNQSTAFRPDSTPHRSQATRTRSGTDGLKAILHSRTPAASFRAHRRGEPRPTPTRDRRPHSANPLRQPTPPTHSANPTPPTRSANPEPHGHAAIGTTNVRWDLSRPSAGRSSPQHVPGQPNHQSTAVRTNLSPAPVPSHSDPQRDGRLKSHPTLANSSGIVPCPSTQ